MTRVLTQRELNRALLARQLLLKRSSLSVPKALEQMADIQNQYAPSAPIVLRARLRRKRRASRGDNGRGGHDEEGIRRAAASNPGLPSRVA